MDDILGKAREVAEQAALAAAQLAKEYFQLEKEITEKDEHGDLVTTVDHLAEAEILRRIRESFPEHLIRSEEGGCSLPHKVKPSDEEDSEYFSGTPEPSGVESDWLWLVDPLDGTNNYALGLPVYGVSITLLHRKIPMLGVICESHTGTLYSAERGKGAVCGGKPIRNKPAVSLQKTTVGWIQGHQVQKEPAAMKLKHLLDERCKRVLRLWAPSIQWSMLARGDLDAIVLYNSEGDDLYAGILLAREAGAAVIDFGGDDFDGMNPEPYLIACHPSQTSFYLSIVKEAIL